MTKRAWEHKVAPSTDITLDGHALERFVYRFSLVGRDMDDKLGRVDHDIYTPYIKGKDKEVTMEPSDYEDAEYLLYELVRKYGLDYHRSRDYQDNNPEYFVGNLFKVAYNIESNTITTVMEINALEY